jgi:hypothetical protein
MHIFKLLPLLLLAANAFASSPSDGSLPSYAVAVTGVVPYSSAQDIIEIKGDGTKTLHIKRIALSGIANGTTTVDVFLIKQSQADKNGTSTVRTIVPLDSSDSASVATVKSYTAAPSGGSVIGYAAARKFTLVTSTTTVGLAPLILDFAIQGVRPMNLQGNESLTVNLGGANITSGAIDADILWSEE